MRRSLHPLNVPPRAGFLRAGEPPRRYKLKPHRRCVAKGLLRFLVQRNLAAGRGDLTHHCLLRVSPCSRYQAPDKKKPGGEEPGFLLSTTSRCGAGLRERPWV